VSVLKGERGFLGKGCGGVVERAKEKILDDSFSTDLAGESRDFSESNSNTLFAFGLALLLVYLILSAQFESFIDPVIIILTVPMAVAGAFFSLWLLGQSWNIFSQIGTILTSNSCFQGFWSGHD
jgi:multidrug efflux pump